MSKHEMTFERGGRKAKKKAVKTTKKSSPLSRQVKSVKRQAQNALGIVGGVVVVWWLIQLATGGG